MRKRLLYKFVPKYTEVGLFLMSLTFLLLLISSPPFRKEMYNFIFSEMDEKVIFLPFLILAGIFLSTYHVFTKRLITKLEKYVMVVFAVLLNAIVGVEAGFYILKQAKGFWIIFPILNIASAILLIILLRAGIIKEDSLSDKQAKKTEVILGTIFTFLIFWISHYILKNYWAITFSICTSYAINLSEAFDNFISHLFKIFKPKI